jgi:hypothetical protein
LTKQLFKKKIHFYLHVSLLRWPPVSWHMHSSRIKHYVYKIFVQLGIIIVLLYCILHLNSIITLWICCRLLKIVFWSRFIKPFYLVSPIVFYNLGTIRYICREIAQTFYIEDTVITSVWIHLWNFLHFLLKWTSLCKIKNSA